MHQPINVFSHYSPSVEYMEDLTYVPYVDKNVSVLIVEEHTDWIL